MATQNTTRMRQLRIVVLPANGRTSRFAENSTMSAAYRPEILVKSGEQGNWHVQSPSGCDEKLHPLVGAPSP